MALVYGNISLPWIVSYDESAEVHSEAFVLYDGTTKYAPVDKSGKSLTFTGVEKGTGFIADVEGEVGDIHTLSYENMSNTGGNTWSKELGANDWIKSYGYYFKVIDNSSNITFIGCGSVQYSVETCYADDAAAEAAAQGNTYAYGGGPCPPQ